MIRLEHIKKKNDCIICDAFIEDCKKPIIVEYSPKNNEIKTTALPEGYEWCVSHLSYAKRALREMVASEKMENKKTIMWY